MKVEVKKEDILIRQADKSGRVSIGARRYGGEKVELAVLGVIQERDGEGD